MLASGYNWWLPTDLSAYGYRIDQLIVMVHWFMAILFVGWGIYFVYCLIRFRARAGHQASTYIPKAKAAKYVEVLVVIVEVVLLLVFSIPIWAQSRGAEHAPKSQDTLQVHVVAEQFAWNFHYPGRDGVWGPTNIELISADNPIGLDRSDSDAQDDIVTINQFHVPVGKDVLVHLRSKDVIHSFSLPLLRIKQDVIPGMSIPQWFKAIKTTDEVREEMKKKYPTDPQALSSLKNHVAMDEYKALDGTLIVAKLGNISRDTITALSAAGIHEIEAAPFIPTEIACAQLCGLGHFRMRGYLRVDTESQYAEWYAGEERFLEDVDEGY